MQVLYADSPPAPLCFAKRGVYFSFVTLRDEASIVVEHRVY